MTRTPTNGDISLYYHIPFCTRKCPYCHFYVVPNKPQFQEALTLALDQEWEQIVPLLQKNSEQASPEKRLRSVYFGGGTPSLFEPKRLCHILNTIEKTFPNVYNAEITLEANPESLSYESLCQFKECGINRISLGVQSFHDHELALLGRSHSKTKVAEVIESIKRAGIDNISIDLMFEVPRQTLATWQSSLEMAAGLPITHLSLYNLTIEPHTLYAKKKQEITPLLPDPETAAKMYQEAISFLETKGLIQYEISAFCRDNLMSVHNTGYWLGRPFFGLGPSAFSYFANKRFRNTADLNRYCKLLGKGLSPVDFEEVVPPSDRRRELLAIALRMRQGVDLTSFEACFGPLEEKDHLALKKLQEEDFIVRAQNKISLSQKGILFYDNVAVEII